MKTDIYRFERDQTDVDSISELASKIAVYNGLDRDQELKLNLLCEELIELLPNLLKYGNGRFWIENKEREYELHAVVEADELLSGESMESILSVSKTGRNVAAVGIMGRIRAAAEMMLARYAQSVGTSGAPAVGTGTVLYDKGQFADPIGYTNEWSLEKYRTEVTKGTEAWDELEKSIVANMADDVTVGIMGGRVEITVKKKF
ncbi:MAG: hypothetical protein II820_05000 [Ruminiclostridium sp.]|nr:hypothetical protein [Ruminiclostridium sp.]